MAFYRLKHSFTAGELSPLMDARVDFERYKNGCKVLLNAYAASQGPAVRRSGFEFVYDLTSIGLDPANPIVRTIPFIFNELQAYAMIFFMHTDGQARVVFATTQPNGTNGLVVYGDPAIAECPPGTAQNYTPGDIVSITLPAGWDIEKFDWAQSADEMWIAQPKLQPHIIKRHDSECWELVAVTFTDQPTDWSDANGWPEKIIFHQQRIAFAATLLRRQTVWLSKAGDFSDFGISSPLVDSDAVTFTLDSGTQNRIQWLISGKYLYVGTLGNEWTVSGNDRTSLTPTNILAQRQTNHGSEPLKPVLIGLTTLFLERKGRIINEFRYELNYDSYTSLDISILAPHLTEIYSIKDWSYQQTPNSILWSIREDGTLLGTTYQQQHKIVCWHRHETDGKFKTVTCIPGATREDSTWVVVQRDIQGQPRYYLEKLAEEFIYDDAEWGRFLDSHLVYQGAPTKTLSKAYHLAGKTIGILADGTVHPDVVVSNTGNITLNNEYSHIVIGLPFVTEIRPLLADIESDKVGTSLGRTQRITSVTIDLYKSLGMWIGRDDSEDGEAEEEVPFRVAGDLLGNAVPLYTGLYKLHFLEGYDRKSEYFIRQRQPLPLLIRGIVDLVEVNQ